jgi:hypothetical protein
VCGILLLLLVCGILLLLLVMDEASCRRSIVWCSSWTSFWPRVDIAGIEIEVERGAFVSLVALPFQVGPTEVGRWQG